jgi:hypothetical protein
MPTAEYDLRYVREALDILESYLLSSDIFRNVLVDPPAGEPPYPALTLGGILLSEMRVNALKAGNFLQPAEAAAWEELSSRLYILRRKWQKAWNNKAERSFNARLTQWKNFLEDYRQHPQAHANRYAYEVRLRVMLDLLAEQAASLDPHQLDILRSLDAVLRHRLQAGSFIWSEKYISGFPQDRFWYLYGQLSVENGDDA